MSYEQPFRPPPFRHTPYRPWPRPTAPVRRNPHPGTLPACAPVPGHCYGSHSGDDGGRGETSFYRAVAPTGTGGSALILNSEFLILNWTYTFSAKEKDAETGLSYFGARYYSSDLSIWLSVDPMSDKYPSLSPYVYCADNPVKLVDPNGMEIGGDPKKKKHYNTPPSLKYIGFFVRHSSAAINIGEVKHNSSNISTVATRFATRGEILLGSANNQDDRGSQNGAFRHTLWQAAITSMYGESVAKQAGNAHEKNPSVDLSQHYFSNLDEADQVVDLLNNQIGRSIGKQNTGANMNELAQIVLSEFESNGLYTASQMAEGKYVITLNRISESQYIQLKSIFENLNCYGRTPEEQGDIDQQNKEKMERLQQTWGTMK